MKWTSTFQGDVLPAPTWRQALSPWWWIQDQEMEWRWIDAFRRQPFANFFSVIIGVGDHKRWFISTMDGSNFPVRGWGFAWVLADSCLIPRPWVAWRGAHHDFGAGWKSHGGFGINWRRANAANAGQEYHR